MEIKQTNKHIQTFKLKKMWGGSRIFLKNNGQKKFFI